MATKQNTKATNATNTKRNAPAPAPATSGNSSQAQQATGTAAQQAAAPQAQLFTVGKMPPVQASSVRHYAQHVATQLAAQHPKGFTLAQYRAALIASAAASSMRQPKGGWAGHNMPTWASNPKQAWLVPVAKG